MLIIVTASAAVAAAVIAHNSLGSVCELRSPLVPVPLLSVLEQWLVFLNEVIPAGPKRYRLVVLGILRGQVVNTLT